MSGFVTANATCASSLRAELESGTALTTANFIAVQEHKLGTSALNAAEMWASKAGWRLLGESGYWKEKALGGGTAVLSRPTAALRPAPGGLKS